MIASREEGGTNGLAMYCHQIKIGGKYDLVKLYRLHTVGRKKGTFELFVAR